MNTNIAYTEDEETKNIGDNLYIELANKEAKMPVRSSLQAAGYDLFSAEDEDKTITKGSILAIETGVKVGLPNNTYGRIAARSGLALKNGINVLGGVIDADYRDTIKVILINHSNKDVVIEKHQRIAQLILEQIKICPIIKVDDINKTCGSTERDKGGFGSTGKK